MSEFSQKDLINKEHIKNLIAIALADGVIDEMEMDVLQDKAEEIGIDPVELDLLIVQADDIDFAIPDDPAEKEAFLSEFVYMMMVDGDIHPEEYDLCLKFAGELQLKEAELDKIIELSKQLWELENE